MPCIHMYYEYISQANYAQSCPVCQIKCLPICIMLQFSKLSVHQIYFITVCMLFYLCNRQLWYCDIEAPAAVFLFAMIAIVCYGLVTKNVYA